MKKVSAIGRSVKNINLQLFAEKMVIKGQGENGVVNKNLGILQKAQILDEVKRIIRVKASDGGYDRDDDRIDPTLWRFGGYNPPFADSHKTHETSDNRLGEIINAFYKDSFYWNDIHLDTPGEEDPQKWTDGEKLANRIWNNAKAEKDIRFSVGFLPDLDKMSRNDKGGIDFAGQEQTELSVVLMPSNTRAGNKTAGATEKAEGDNMPGEILLLTDTIRGQLRAKLKANHPNGGLIINGVFPNEVVFNNWGYDRATEQHFDIWYKQEYVIVNNIVDLIGQPTEVVETMAYIGKNYDEFSDLKKQNSKLQNENNVLKQQNAELITKTPEKKVEKKELKAVNYDDFIKNAVKEL